MSEEVKGGEEAADELRDVAKLREQRIAEALREGIVAERLYEPYVAAALLGIRSVRAGKTISDIPEALLPVHWVGPGSGMKRYYGRNLIQYIRSTGPILAEEPLLAVS